MRKTYPCTKLYRTTTLRDNNAHYKTDF